ERRQDCLRHTELAAAELSDAASAKKRESQLPPRRTPIETRTAQRVAAHFSRARFCELRQNRDLRAEAVRGNPSSSALHRFSNLRAGIADLHAHRRRAAAENCGHFLSGQLFDIAKNDRESFLLRQSIDGTHQPS